jgi:hypothetical protein
MLAQEPAGKTVTSGKLKKSYQNGKSCRSATALLASSPLSVTFFSKEGYSFNNFFYPAGMGFVYVSGVGLML